MPAFGHLIQQNYQDIRYRFNDRSLFFIRRWKLDVQHRILNKKRRRNSSISKERGLINETGFT